MASNRRIKISSTSDIQSEHFTQKIVNHNTGKASIIDKPDPQHWKKSSEVLGNPSNPEKYESKGKSQGEPVAEEVKVKQDQQELEGFDTSQL